MYLFYVQVKCLILESLNSFVNKLCKRSGFQLRFFKAANKSNIHIQLIVSDTKIV